MFDFEEKPRSQSIYQTLLKRFQQLLSLIFQVWVVLTMQIRYLALWLR